MNTISLRLVFGAAMMAAVALAGCSKDPNIAKREHFARAQAYIKDDKHREAVVELRNAVQLDPKFGSARHELAKTYLKLQDWPQAYREFVRAADLLPDDIDAQLGAAEMLVRARQFEDAGTRVERALALDPKNVNALLLKANIAAGLKDLDSALTAVQDAVTVDPDRGLTYTNLAQLQWAKGDTATAAATFDQAIKTDPRSPLAHLAQANFLWATGNRAGAEAALRKTIEVDPDHLVAHRALAILLMTTKRLPEAEAQLKSIAQTAKTPVAELDLADFYLLTRRPQEGREIYRRLATSDDKNARTAATLRLAALEIRDGQRATGAEFVDKLVSDDPKNVRALTAQAELRLADNRPEEALRSVALALESDADYARAHLVHGQILVRLGRVDEGLKALTEAATLDTVTGEPELALARVHLASGQSEAALRYAATASSRQPTSALARLTHARALIARNDLAAAQAELERLEKEGFSGPSFLTTRAGLQVTRKDIPGARRTLARALEIAPGDVEAHAILTRLDFQEKRPEAAAARVTAAVQGPGSTPGLLLLAARTQAATGNRQEAEALARKAVNQDPLSLSAYQFLGQLYASGRQLPEAQREFEQILQRNPKSVAALTMVGILLQMQNKPDEAAKRYEEALQVDPRAGVAANNLAWAMAERGDNLDLALQHAQAAVAALPNHPDAHDTLGWVYYKKGLADQAVAAFERAVEIDKNGALFHYHLALACAKAGYRDRARRSLEEALRLQPNFQGADEARALLSRL
jgi:putative PEP-CTERM system TPR-repeat lipoprotein